MERFHGKPIKDHVHTPDWSTKKRLNYTKFNPNIGEFITKKYGR